LYAYLEIMKNQPFKLIYFDGFAGCGRIEPDSSGIENSLIESVALQVLGMEHPKLFDIYYLVDKHRGKTKQLKKLIEQNYPTKKGLVFIVNSDCNDKLINLADFMKSKPNYRALAFIDPFGMGLNWQSLQYCKGLGIDMWILIPTGIGVNRLLMRNETKIPESWLKRLEKFYGLSIRDLKNHFYYQSEQINLFGDTLNSKSKLENAASRAADLYRDRLAEVWKFVSKPFPMKNSSGSIDLLRNYISAT
jgi:three-Cys-motif partner protein